MTIKDFAKLCKCNVQTLRYYDRINLLKPSKVDAYTGYRYYTEEQSLDFVKIKNLQQASFSLQEIRQLLNSDDSQIYDAFTMKIEQMEKVLQKLKKIQGSYQNEYMSFKNLVDAILAYKPQAEFGIDDATYKRISDKVEEYFAMLLPQNNDCAKDCSETTDDYSDNSDDTDFCEEEEFLNIKNNPYYVCLFEKHGWKHVKDFIGELPTLLDDEYVYHFERADECEGYAFCNTMLGMILDANPNKKLILACNNNRSEDGINHFWLFKRR